MLYVHTNDYFDNRDVTVDGLQIEISIELAVVKLCEEQKIYYSAVDTSNKLL